MGVEVVGPTDDAVEGVEGLRARIERRGADVVVHLVGTCDGFAEAALREALDRGLAARSGAVEVDLHELRFLGAAGYWSLAAARRRCVEAGGSFRVTGARPVLPHVAQRLALDIGCADAAHVGAG